LIPAWTRERAAAGAAQELLPQPPALSHDAAGSKTKDMASMVLLLLLQLLATAAAIALPFAEAPQPAR
jgi:hypothetical protein